MRASLWRSFQVAGLPRRARLNCLSSPASRRSRSTVVPEFSEPVLDTWPTNSSGSSSRSSGGSSSQVSQTQRPQQQPATRRDRHSSINGQEILENPANYNEASSSRRIFPSLSNTKTFGFKKPKTPTSETVKATSPEAPKVTRRKRSGPRKNPVGVQLLSESLHEQLFPGPPLQHPPQKIVNLSGDHLRINKLDPKKAAVLDEINFKMPRLQGENIREHFLALGKDAAEPYLGLAEQFSTTEVPEMPKKWVLDEPGWFRYDQDGSYTAVDNLEGETSVCFDVEVLYKLSPYPVMATAVTPNAWYSWLSPSIFEPEPDILPPPLPKWDQTPRPEHPRTLIPLFSQGSKRERIVVGHNVGYDRARVAEEYTIDGTSTRWLDTLALHMATRGITSVQRPKWMEHQAEKRRAKAEKEDTRQALKAYATATQDTALLENLDHLYGEEDDVAARKWEDVTATNSLAEVARLHCGIKVDKSTRDIFGEEGITHASQLVPQLEELIKYCANDVKVTHDVYKHVFPMFLESCPHPASFAGILPMGSAFLPVNESWQTYLRRAEETYKEMDENVKKSLMVLAERMRRAGPRTDDPWTSQLDWSPKKARWPDEGPGSPGSALTMEVTSDSIISPEIETQAIGALKVDSTSSAASDNDPQWYQSISQRPSGIPENTAQRRILPLLLQTTFDGHPLVFLAEHHWCFRVRRVQAVNYSSEHGEAVEPGHADGSLRAWSKDYAFFRLASGGLKKTLKPLGKAQRSLLKSGKLASPYPGMLVAVIEGQTLSDEDIRRCADDLHVLGASNPFFEQMNRLSGIQLTGSKAKSEPSGSDTPLSTPGEWPKWYWDLTGPTSRMAPGELDITQKKTASPLLLRLQWKGYPLFHHPEFKWTFRVPYREKEAVKSIHGEPVDLEKPPSLKKMEKKDKDNYKKSRKKSKRGDDEEPLEESEQTKELRQKAEQQALEWQSNKYVYFRLPHKDGAGNNVGSPFARSFVKAFEAGDLSSAAESEINGDVETARIASEATKMNVLCSYWVSSRERIMDQMVVYQDPYNGMILPKVITMGTVTRRAVENVWLTAANAKKNRVGSELKAMVRAPPGYAIVGADVDSEELWISSVMGDSQFGMHGATAIGWMTLEGTKAAGTDLHSKTAAILGTSRDAAKVFNYSRIYGAGKKHAIQLLLQGDATLSPEDAKQKADDLYSATKGTKTSRDEYGEEKKPPAAIPSLWHGGSESFLFNTLEAIAISDRPRTPALGCGVTKALSKSYLEKGFEYLPSRINWVVQSSGVDYLHLLIVSMEFLIKRYDIKARYLISVHDEVRYLAKEEDRYRTALALQIANAWTRALFCYNLGMDDLPQGVAFFSAVDIDHVLRKEVLMECSTPSHPGSIPPGESLDFPQLLQKTNQGDLGQPVITEPLPKVEDTGAPLSLFKSLHANDHYMYLDAQVDQSKKKAKEWLDTQRPLRDAQGRTLPIKRSERARVMRETKEIDPDHFQSPTIIPEQLFTRNEIDSFVDSVSPTRRSKRVNRSSQKEV